jgi:thiamine biosynthesis lipoprotein
MPDKKPNWNRSAIYPVVLIILMLIVYQYRESKKSEAYIQIEGKTMGTSYHIKYIDERKENHKNAIDSILIEFNNSLSTYIPDSEISRFNQSKSLEIKSPFFYPVLLKSKEVYNSSEGSFDPTIMPIVNAWGFGFKNEGNIDSASIDSLLLLIGFDKIDFTNESVSKAQDNMMLDFSAIAKGYGVDVVAEYLERCGVQNYMVEIGGEVRCMGKNDKKSIWLIGIDNPKYNEDGKSLKATVKLKDMALATSGNYRNFYVRDGVKYAHTINPKTGYPVNHSLLSASVFAKDCMTADAYATAFMVSGKDKAIEISEEKDLLTYLVYSDTSSGEVATYMSEGLRALIIEN